MAKSGKGMYGSVEQAFVGRDERKNGCEGGYSDDGFRFKISSCACAIVKAFKRECSLVPRAHVSFGQFRVLELTKRHVGSGNEIGVNAVVLPSTRVCLMCEPASHSNFAFKAKHPFEIGLINSY